MKTAYVGLGSNLENPVWQIKTAIQHLQSSPDVHVIKQSSLYSSQPMGPQNQPDFVNAVVEIQTTLSIQFLLRFLQEIECQQKRQRTSERWGPRTIDCDILLFENDVIDTEQLKIPHPGLSEREFVVYPLAEIAPDLVLPNGTSIEMLKAQCPRRGLQIITSVDEEIIK